MKRYISIICLAILALAGLKCYSQAKKPTIMVIPADVWCTNNGYIMKYNGQGTDNRIPDYERAYQENSDLVNVTAKIGELMAERGFPLKNMLSTIKSLRRAEVENEMTVSSTSGAVLAETPLERVMSRAKADILVEITWQVNSTGPKKSITYTMIGKDAYTNKEVANAQGTGPASFSAELPVLLEEAVLSNMDNFLSQLQTHFDDLAANGREVVVNMRIFDNGSGLSFESEFRGEELTDIIDDWMADNTVNHRYNLTDAGETVLTFEQVRIPLYRENGMPMDTRHFGNNLRKYLSKAPYNIPVKVITKGLGQVDLVLGEK